MRLSTIMPSTWHDICRLWTITCDTGIANLLMVIMILHIVLYGMEVSREKLDTVLEFFEGRATIIEDFDGG